MRFRFHAVIGAIAVLAACGDEAEPMPEAVVRDSAGITIVENPAPTTPRVYTLSEPVLQIGAVEGADEYQLHNVRSAIRLSDGRIVITNGTEVRYYHSDGTYIGTTGRQGSGPGEFSGISYMRAIEGDSVLAYDAFNRRVTVLGPDGAYVRDFTPAASVAAATRNGTVLTRTNSRLPEGSVTFHRTTLEFAVQVGDSAVGLRGYPGPETDVRIEGSGGQIMSISLAGVPFARPVYVTSAGDRFYIGSADTWEIHHWSENGTLTRIIRSAVPLTAVNEELLSAYTDAQVEIVRRAAEREGQEPDEAGTRRRIAEQQYPPTAPAFEGLIGTEEGGLWVESFSRPAVEEGPSRWTILDPDGRMTGVIELPARFTPRFISGDTLVGVIRDDLDVEYVRVYTFS